MKFPIRQLRVGDCGDVPLVRPAAAAHDVEVGESLLELGVLSAQLGRVAFVEFGGLVQFGVAFGRGVGSKRTNSLHPRFTAGQCVFGFYPSY